MTTDGPISIAIVGAGPAGLALASTLIQAPDSTSRFRISIYEATSTLVEVGAGVGISGRSFAIARALGFEDKFNEMDQQKGKSDAEFVGTLRRGDLGAQSREFHRHSFGRGAAFHRAQFRGALAEHVTKFPQVEISFDKRLKDVVQNADGASELSFTDGTKAVADIVVGCDGVRSPTRRILLTQASQDLGQPDLLSMIPAVWTGARAYRATFPVEKLNQAWIAEVGPNQLHRVHTETVAAYVGIGHHIVAYLIANRTLVNVVLFVSEFEREGEILPDAEYVKLGVDTSSLVPHYFSHWAREAQVIVENMGPATLWAINVTQELPFFAHKNIAITGDAAHAITPHLANGANQALEDAYVLGRVLSTPSLSRSNIPAALRAYDAIRRPHAQAVVRASRAFGLLMDWMYIRPGDKEPLRDEEEVKKETELVTSWVSKGNIEDQVVQAVTKLQEEIAAA